MHRETVSDWVQPVDNCVHKKVPGCQANFTGAPGVYSTALILNGFYRKP